MNRNYLENKLLSIYLNYANIPQIEFKKINENEFLYGTLKISLTVDRKNPLNVTSKIIDL